MEPTAQHGYPNAQVGAPDGGRISLGETPTCGPTVQEDEALMDSSGAEVRADSGSAPREVSR